ncbi:MAG: FG-GAP-like repeat-containing protein [Myxococcota bacterium]
MHRRSLEARLVSAALGVVALVGFASDGRPRRTLPAPATFAEQIAFEEYVPRPHGAAWKAPNRAAGWSLTWDSEALVVEDRGGVLVRVRTTGVGRNRVDASLPPRFAEQSARERRRLERRWEGLTEWFENRRDALEHGWTLDARPEGDGPLRLRVAIDGATAALLDARTARLAPSRGSPITYGAVRAWDADGRTLPVWFEAHAAGLDVRVDDADARYPVTVDPPMIPVEIEGAEVIDGRLGISIAAAGDVNRDGLEDVVVGADGYMNAGSSFPVGAAFLYLGSAQGLQTAILVDTGDAPGEQFGHAVAGGDFNGDGYSDLAVGAPGIGNGKVAFYPGGSNGPALAPTITLFAPGAGAQLGARFGAALANAHDVNDDDCDDLLVGAPDFDDPLSAAQIDEGRAFVYSGATLINPNPTPWLVFDLNQAGAHLGAAVAGIGDLDKDGFAEMLVGAPGLLSAQNGGGAVIYKGGPDPQVDMGGTLNPMSPNAGFGSSVAGLGDVDGDGKPDFAVGAPHFTSTAPQEGAVFIYGLSGQSAPLVFYGGAANALFGAAVAGAGDLNGDGYADLVVGAPTPPNATTASSFVRIFFGAAQGPTQTRSRSVRGTQMAEAVGASVAGLGDINGDGFGDVAFGAPGHDVQSTNGLVANAGRFTVLGGLAEGLRLSGATHSGATAQANAGAAVSSAGDVNGDGLTDVLIGVPGFNGRGEVRLSYGLRDGATLEQINWRAQGTQQGERLGASVASAGDVNGDGFADVLVGAPFLHVDGPGQGGVKLYLGSGSGPATSAAWAMTGPEAGARLGFSVAGDCDLDGDGYSDLIIGAPGVRAESGEVWLFRGSAQGPSTTPVILPGPPRIAAFGYAVACAGDVDGDGLSDLVVGAPQMSDSRGVLGRAYVFSGRAAGPPQQTREVGGQPGEEGLGVSVAGAGDFDGDGYSDFAVGLVPPSSDAGSQSAVHVYFGGPPGSPPRARWDFPAPLSSEAGASVSGAGDVNGDGYGDLLVGLPGYTTSTILTRGGRIALFLGSAVPAKAPDMGWSSEGASVGARLGAATGGAGDINGDGFSDVLVGGPGASAGQGEARLYLGGDRAPGRAWRLAQHLEGDQRGAGYRALGGLVTFSAELTDEVAGLEPVILEVEVKPVGTPFNGLFPLSSAPVSSGLAQATLMNPPRGRYHWRARVVVNGIAGRWRAYGGNDESQADFVFGLPPVFLPDAGLPPADAGPGDAGASTDAGLTPDAGPGQDGGFVSPDGGAMGTFETSGCGCTGVRGAPIFTALALLLAARRRRSERV